jgi:hypothetical protein
LPSPNKQQSLFESLNQPQHNISPNISKQMDITYKIEVSLISIDRFAASNSVYEPIIACYKSINGHNFDAQSKTFTFPILQYRTFIYRMKNIQNVKVDEFPLAIVNTFIDKKKKDLQVKLDNLPPSLLDSLFPYQKEGVR